jgi:hypothetical protein
MPITKLVSGRSIRTDEIAVLTSKNRKPAAQIISAAIIGRENSNGIGRELIAASPRTKTA